MSRFWMWAGCGAMVLGLGYLLWSNGYTNLLAYGMLLLCPLMHLFMHRGHSHGSDSARATENDSQTREEKTSCH